MNKITLLILLILTLILTGCSGSAANTAAPASNVQNESAAELSVPMQVAIGMMKLDGTDNAVTVEQASELLPLWQTLQVLYGSDTAATEEIDALIEQIQATMTDDQMQAITALNLTRQDMFSIMQSQGMGGATRGGGTTTSNAGGFGPGAGGFAGGPPPGGAMPLGDDPSFQDVRRGAQSSDSTTTTDRPAAMDPNRIPTPLIQAVIEYLKTKGSS